MSTIHVVVVVVVVVVVSVSLSEASGFNMFRARRHVGRHVGSMVPRCSAASKPCRIRAMMEAGLLDHPQEIMSHACSCPRHSPCSENWEAHRDRVIVRELITDGTINMTLSMMFCTPMLPQRRCSDGEMALRLKGMAQLPTEVDVIHCSCPDRRPLVLHSTYTGHDHMTYSSYVCGNHKRRCKRRRSNPDTCMEYDPYTQTITYPCKCTSGTVCRPVRLYHPYNFICKRTRSG